MCDRDQNPNSNPFERLLTLNRVKFMENQQLSGYADRKNEMSWMEMRGMKPLGKVLNHPV